MIWNWFRLHPRALDVGLAALTFAISASASTRHPHQGVGIALGAVASLSLLWRRDRPISVVGVTTAATVAALAFGGWPVPFQLAIALGTLAISGTEYGRSIAAASILATLFTLVADGRGLEETGFHTVFLIAAWFVGDSVGSRRAYVREIEEKAERLERERETEARRAVAEEQARIGRELHDVIAHALSVIVVQAGAADDVFEVEPERAHDAVRAINAAARDALDDLRRVLGTLQDGNGYQPQPGLGRLDSLVEQVRATGLDVSLQVEGAPRPLPASVDLSAFRIVQEALTNVIKHADAEHAKVRVRFGEELLLEIRDDGRGSANGNGHGAGSGLIGMRERVALLGGSVETGNAAGGGFLVSAQIPV
jgi:signal transduction histidine kinase